MSATEDDTELRDLLIQNLENSGVLNKLKAELRAAVFLAMDEQDKLENKSPLVNENLKKCLNTKDGRLVASLILDFLQVFDLDFSLAVFQPEISSLNGLDGRDQVCVELNLSQSELNRNSPVLLELVRRGRHKAAEGDRSVNISEEPTQRQIAHAQKKFDFYDKDGSGSVLKEDLKTVFTDLFPRVNRNMLETFVADELKAADKTFCQTVDVQLFLDLYKRLFAECRAVVVQDSDVSLRPEDRISCPPVSKIPRYKGQSVRGQSESAAQDLECGTSLGTGDFQQQVSRSGEACGSVNSSSSTSVRKDHLDLNLDDDPDDGDSFFDDPLPKPQKTYGCLSVLAGNSEDVQDERPCGLSQASELRKVETSRSRESPAGSLSETPRPGGGGSSMSLKSQSRNAASDSRERSVRDSKALNDKSGSLHLDEDVEYDDDFNSHRSDLSKSELSIGEEIEEVSIEGPDNSDKLEDTTQDLSVSQLSQSHGADYMEDVA